AGRVPRGALPRRAQPREGDAVRVVAEPVHGMRPPLHVLLRPRLRGPGRSRRAEVSVTFSVPTLDREVWARTEPGTAPPEQRLRVLKRLVEGGVRASVGMAPI